MAKRVFNIYKLHFTSPLHIGNAKDDYSTSLRYISSDTMYAAITSCIAKLGYDIPEDGDLGCTISSLFPFYQKENGSEPILFFPKPLKQELPNTKDPSNVKKIKKVNWLDKACFEKVLNGSSIVSNDSELSKIKGEYCVYSDDNFDEKFISTQVSSRVKVSRDFSEDAKPFYMDRVYFSDYSGLYFIADGDISLMEKGLSLLQSEGIGTDRNIGNGFFEYEKDEIEINIPDEVNHVMAISTFIPESKEQLRKLLSGENVAYDIIRRGGWITTPPFNTFRKDAIYAFTSASVFSKIDNISIAGKIVDLNPKLGFEPKIGHPIWRSGKSLFLPIKL